MADEKKSPANKDRSEEIAQQEQRVLEKADTLIETALKGVSDVETPQEVMLGEDNVADKFKGLPMRELIAAPLIAAAEAQQRLAGVAWDFYERIAFNSKDGKPTTDTRLLEFTVKRPVEQGGKMSIMEQKVSAPFIGLVPIPSLLIDRVDVDFQMEVTATNTEVTKSGASADTKISGGGWWGVKAEISGNVSSSRENTRSTNQTAKYQVHVTASQQPQTEGLSKLMDIMASCIEPIPVKQES